MKNSEIAKILGISEAAVSMICKGNENFSRYNIEKVKYYKNFELKIEEIFTDPIFIKICDTVINKAKNSDCNNITEIKRFAVQCKIWGKSLCDKNECDGIPSLAIGPKDLLISEDMLNMLDITLRRSEEKEVIERAAILYNLSNNLNKKLK